MRYFTILTDMIFFHFQNVYKSVNKGGDRLVDSSHLPLLRNKRSIGREYSEYPDDYETDARIDHKYQLDVPTLVQSDNGNVIHNRSSLRRSKDRPVEPDTGDSLHVVYSWPDASKQLGQLSAVSLDTSGNVVVFHRGDRVWTFGTFLDNNVYSDIDGGAIVQNTIVTFHPTSGIVLHEWGSNL